MRNLILISFLALASVPALAQTTGCGQGPSTPLDNLNGSGENRDLREAQGGGGPSLGFSTCEREDGPRRFGPQFDRDKAVDSLTAPDPKADPDWGIVKTNDAPIALPTEARECIAIDGLSEAERAALIAKGKVLCPVTASETIQ